MLITPDKSSTIFWKQRKFWVHLTILFAIFVYLYSPLLDYALGHHTHSRPHNHIPVKLLHLHDHVDGDSHSGLETTDAHICTLDNTGLILLGIFIAFIAFIRQIMRNPFVYKIQTIWLEILSIEYPPPNPPPRLLNLSI